MTVIELPLTEEIEKALAEVSTDKREFILDALKQKLRETKIDLIKNELIEGYKSSHAENTSLLNDFKHVDLEHWDEHY